MPRLRLPSLTYANVTASLALFIALGGTSYAVTALPRNSVGTPQLKSGAVSTPKLKDGAVTADKLAADARARGPRGAQGPAGGAGPKGADGPAGPPGPSAAYVDARPGSTQLPTAANVRKTFAELGSLPAGAYVLTGQTVFWGGGGVLIRCWVAVNGVTLGQADAVVGGSGPAHGTLSPMTTTTQVGPFRATLECAGDTAVSPAPSTWDAKLIATRVGSIN